VEGIIIASGIGAIGAASVFAMSIRIRRNDRPGGVPASVLTPLTDDWYEQTATWLLTLPVAGREKWLADTNDTKVADTLRMIMYRMQVPEAA